MHVLEMALAGWTRGKKRSTYKLAPSVAYRYHQEEAGEGKTTPFGWGSRHGQTLNGRQ